MLESLGVRQGLHGPAFLLPFFSSLALDLRKIWFKIAVCFCPERPGTDEGHGQGLTDSTDRLYMKLKQKRKGVR
jgi:hypothetical protein